MSIPILIEPTSTGFSATTGGPLHLSAQAASAGEVVQAIQDKIAGRLENGAILIEHSVQRIHPPIPITPLAENPLFDHWLSAVESYRHEQEKQEGPSEAP